MRFTWLPRPVIFLWTMFLGSAALWQLQTRNPERYNVRVILNLGQRSVVILGALTLIGMLWLFLDSWEQQIARKPKRGLVELTRIDRFYGGIVIVRTLPRRVWDAASEGDRLIKRSRSLTATLQQRSRGTSRDLVGEPSDSSPE